MKKNIVVGVCGSIAAYKSPDVIRGLRRKGWDVRVIMTAEATKFITPLTIEVVSANRVYLDMFARDNWDIAHISLNDFSSIILVVAATANIIGKTAAGICDDLLTCAIAASGGKVIFAPAMDRNMWSNKIVQENVAKLKKHGYLFIGPDKGALASGKTGIGRLAPVEQIIAGIEQEV